MRFSEVTWDSEEERTLFLEEAWELLAALEEGALQPDPPMDVMFRAAHTLKGSGGMLGLTEWVEEAHRVEDAMDRRGKPDWKWTPEIQKLVLTTVDGLRAELEGRTRKEAPTLVGWRLSWDPACAMPGVRQYQAWDALNRAAPGTLSDPPPDQLAEWEGLEGHLWVPQDLLPEHEVQEILSDIDDLINVEPVPVSPSHDASREAQEKTRSVPERREGMLRIGADTLESILEGLGELLLDHGQLEHLLQDRMDQKTRAVMDHLRRRALDLQDATLRARMLPLDTLFRQYPRAVHDIAQKLEKVIQIRTSGGETELDRVVMDRLHEPLLHLIRNSCDHGIETPERRRALGKPEMGTIHLRAYAAQGHVHVQLEDDGGGIDWRKVRRRAVAQHWMTEEESARASEAQLAQLLFRPGVSTADTVTEISGRGVGLDAVQAFLDDIHGSITVESRMGRGTTFHLELPMTMAIMSALLVDAGPWTVGFPIAAVEHIEDLTESLMGTVLGQQAVPDANAPLPAYSLAELLDPAQPHRDRYIVRIKDGRSQAALAVDNVRGQQEVVVKPVEGLGNLAPWLSGVALLGDGRVALMVDARRLVPATTGSEIVASDVEDDMVLRPGSNQMELLVFGLGDGQHYGINVYKTREVLTASPVARVPGQHPWLDGFLHIRGQAVPQVNLRRALGLPEVGEMRFVLVGEFDQTVQAFPVAEVDRMVRVAWSEVEPLPAVLDQAPTRHLTGLVVHPALGPIQLIDFEQLLAEVAPPAFESLHQPGDPSLQGLFVWVADDSRVALQQMTRVLSTLGVEVRTFANGEDLWQAVEAGDPLPRLFVLDVEMPRLDGYTLASRIKSSRASRHVPVLLHTSLSGHWHADRARQVKADAVLSKFDPMVLAETVSGLILEHTLANQHTSNEEGTA